MRWLIPIITQPTIWEFIKHFWLSNAFSPVPKASQIELVFRELLPGLIFLLSPGHVNCFNFTCDKRQPDWTGSQRTITRAHIFDNLPLTGSISYQYLLVTAINENSPFKISIGYTKTSISYLAGRQPKLSAPRCYGPPDELSPSAFGLER